jgi:nucleoside-diphosphate-sugar epimerase
MKILITGSTGFVGRHLIPKLIQQELDILEITRNIQTSNTLFGDKTKKHLITEDQEAFTKAVVAFRPDVVIHLASYLTSADSYQALDTLLQSNIYFFCRLLDALKDAGPALFINTGTFAEYFKGDNCFDPAYLYSATKTASRAFLDYYSKVYNFKQTTVVPYTIYGSKDSQKKIIDIIIDSLSSSTQTDLSPGEQVLDFIHIDDVTDFYLHLIDNLHQLPHKSNFQLGTGKGHTLKQLAGIIEFVTQKKSNINWGGKSYRPTDVMYAVADISNINSWHPKIPLSKGIALYVKINQI